jgi:hypothetical protein
MMLLGYNPHTFVAHTPHLGLVVFLTILLCVIVNVTTYALVTFHTERVCTVQHVIMGPRLTSLTRDNLARRTSIAISHAKGKFT